MTNTKYAPGPWAVNVGQISKEMLKGRLHEVVEDANGEVIALCGEDRKSAILMSQAPVMLELLEEIISCGYIFGDSAKYPKEADLAQRIKRVIEDATGGKNG